MSLNKQHELHNRRFGRNLWVGLILGGLIAIVFGLTIVKIGGGDYQIQPAAQGVSNGN